MNLEWLNNKNIGNYGIKLYLIPFILMSALFVLIGNIYNLDIMLSFSVSGGEIEAFTTELIPMYWFSLLAMMSFLYGVMFMYILKAPEKEKESYKMIFLKGFALSILFGSISSTVQIIILAYSFFR